MAYKIVYAEEPKRQKKFDRKWLWVIGAAAAVITGRLLGWDAYLREFLIPGDAAVTVAAFENMLLMLRDGQPVADTFGSFCGEIINGAQIG